MSDSPDVWTVLKIINWSEGFLRKKGIESPRVDVELLLSRSLGLRRLDLYIRFERVLSGNELKAFKALLLRRAAREPVAYILGVKEFYGLSFKVDKRVLIPRPETEHLVDVVVERLKGITSPLIADIGTGSGCIAASLATAIGTARIYAADLSPEVLDAAGGNFRSLGLSDRISLHCGAFFEPLPRESLLDAVVSNPPYVAEGERAGLQDEIVKHEPLSALLAGPDGLDAIRHLVAGAPSRLAPGGLLAVEIGAGQSSAVAEMMGEMNFVDIESVRDYAGIERVLSARKCYG